MPTESEILEQLRQELFEDCSYYSGKVFGSMSSYPEEMSQKVFIEFLEKNGGDGNIFASTYNIEKKTIEILGSFFHSSEVGGNIVPGGSEANVVALWAARNYMRKRKRLENKRVNILVPETRHTSIDKALDLLDVEKRILPVNKYYELEITRVEENIDENTIALVGIVGNTVYGAIDNIPTLSHIAVKHDLWIHIDAAFGGFIYPFVEDSPIFDFRIEGVKSITVDSHKMLGAPIPSGTVLFKKKELSDEIIFHLPYFSGAKTENRTIVGTKSGGSIVATYYLLKYKGFEWLRERVVNNLKLKEYLKEELEKLGFQMKGKCQINVLAAKPPYELENRREYLFEKGWRIGKYQDVWRFILMPTATKEHIDLLLDELRNLC